MNLTIPGELMALNEYTEEQRRNPHLGNRAKRQQTEIVAWSASQLQPLPTDKSYHITFRWYTANRRKDPDNIVSAKKFILDGLVEAGVLPGDGWRHIAGFRDTWTVDKDNPRVEVEIQEMKE